MGRARRFLCGLDYSHAVVRRREAVTCYHLNSRDEVESILALAAESQTVFQAFDLHEPDAMAALEADNPADDAPARTIVLEGGDVVGFFDLSGRFSRSKRVVNIRDYLVKWNSSD